ncbi:MAG: hypothetical protein IJW18_01140 [Lachnospiraceae bacterium]|nr:hypothetical protein [Lachnospiraceae bacterium]
MDKYEYNVRAEQITKLVGQDDYKTAAKISDTIDWRRVRNTNMLMTVATAYEKCGRYEDAKEILLMAYEKAPIGRRLAYRLTELSIKSRDFEEAKKYYEDFVNLSPKDNRRFELLYEINKRQGAAPETLVVILEEYKKNDMDEWWSYELAINYYEAGMYEACVKQCDEIFLWFGEGEVVLKALMLKELMTPLTERQTEVKEAILATIDIEGAGSDDIENTGMEAEAADAVATKTETTVKAESTENTMTENVPTAATEEKKPKKETSEADKKPEGEAKPVRMDGKKPLKARKKAGATAAKKFEKAEMLKQRAAQTIDGDKEEAAGVVEAAEAATSMTEATEEVPPAETTPVNPILTKDTIRIDKLRVANMANDDQIEGQMTLEEVLAMYEEQNPEEAPFVTVTKDDEKSVPEEAPIEEESTEEVSEETNAEATEPEAEENSEEEPVEEKFSEEPSEETNAEVTELEAEEVPEEEPVEEEIPTEVPEETNVEAIELETEEIPQEEPIEENYEETEANEEAYAEEIEPETTEVEDEDISGISEAVSKATDEMMAEAEEAFYLEGRLTAEQKETFKRFLYMRGMEAQLTAVFQAVAEKAPTERSAEGNILVVGDYKSGKTTLAIEVIKEINNIRRRGGRRIAKISGERLNNKGIKETFSMLNDADLLIEHAARMSKGTLQGLLQFMSGQTGGMIVVFEDTKEAVEYIFAQVPEARTYFNHYIELKEIEIAEWVEIARNYCKEKGYIIDDMAKLALSARISRITKDDFSVEFEDIKEIVDEAIRKNSRKHFFKRKNSGDVQVKMLKEIDFK